MAAKSLKILIQTETSERWVFRIPGQPPAFAYCEGCGGDAQMIDLNTAVALSSRGAHELIREIATGSLHSTQTLEGYLMICGNSLRPQPPGRMPEETFDHE